MAKITVNGEVQKVQPGLSLTELIRQNNVEQPDMVSVQVNDDFVDRTEWDALEIKEGDVVDFLYFMGGGAPSFPSPLSVPSSLQAKRPRSSAQFDIIPLILHP